MATTLNPQPKSQTEPFSVDVMGLKPSRYSIEDVYGLIEKKLQVEQGKVTPSTAQQIERLLQGRKTDVLIINDGTVGKLYLSNDPHKGVSIQQIDVQQKLTLTKQFLGYTFSDKDKANLMHHRNMGPPVKLIDKTSGQPFEGYIGVDADTHKLTVLRADKFRMPDSIKGKPITEIQKQLLRDGKALRLDGMIGNDGKLFSAYVRIHAGKKNLHFDRIESQETQPSLKPAQPQAQTTERSPKQNLSEKSQRKPDPNKKRTATALSQPPASTPVEKPGKTKKTKGIRP